MKALAILLLGLALASCADRYSALPYRAPGLHIGALPEAMTQDPDNPPRMACGTAGGTTDCIWY
jgi:hypothetical protein